MLKNKNADLNIKQEAAEQCSRRNIVKISNFNEQQSENVTVIVFEIADKSGVNITKSEIDNFHTLSKKKEILVKEIEI
jgi:hypothetical protein